MSFATSRVFKSCRVLLSPAKSASASATTVSASKTTEKSKRTPQRIGGGLFKLSPVSPALREFLGVHEASRSDAVKKVWAHVKEHNLQKPDNKRVIICDEKLKSIFDGKDTVGFLEVGKLLSRHFIKTSAA